MLQILLCKGNRNINDAWITSTYKDNRAVTINHGKENIYQMIATEFQNKNVLTLSMFLSYSNLASCSARNNSDSVCKSTPTSFAI